MKRSQRGFSTLESLIALAVLFILCVVLTTFCSVQLGVFNSLRLRDISVTHAIIAATLGASAICLCFFGLVPGLISVLWNGFLCIRARRFRFVRDTLLEHYAQFLLLSCALYSAIGLIFGLSRVLLSLIRAIGAGYGFHA